MKKYLSIDVILGVILFVGLTVISVGFVCTGFDEAYVGDYPEWLATGMKIVGFAGTIVFPSSLRSALRDYRETIEEEEEYEGN
jgi:hypothetical protein